eukprot:11394178-Ditylum_brightwellii.AAC.1
MQDDEDIDAVENNVSDGSEADELDNAFNVIPDITDHYNGHKGLKDGVEHKMTANSNKHAWEHMGRGTSQCKKWSDSMVYSCACPLNHITLVDTKLISTQQQKSTLLQDIFKNSKHMVGGQ